MPGCASTSLLRWHPLPERPLLLLDVDGVLCPFGCDEDPPGFERFWTREDWVWLSPAHSDFLSRLARSYRLVWATAWEHQANEIIAPWHGLGPLPVIEFSYATITAASTWKLPSIIAWLEDRPQIPCVWVDDDVGSDALDWARERSAPTKVIRTDPTIGFTEAHYTELIGFAEGIAHGRTEVSPGEHPESVSS